LEGARGNVCHFANVVEPVAVCSRRLLASTFGKLAIFVFSAWSARDNKDSGIIAGLATCGVVLAGTSQAATLMQDFKRGFLTCNSPSQCL
jgi:hypothetical protein